MCEKKVEVFGSKKKFDSQPVEKQWDLVLMLNGLEGQFLSER